MHSTSRDGRRLTTTEPADVWLLPCWFCGGNLLLIVSFPLYFVCVSVIVSLRLSTLCGLSRFHDWWYTWSKLVWMATIHHCTLTSDDDQPIFCCPFLLLPPVAVDRTLCARSNALACPLSSGTSNSNSSSRSCTSGPTLSFPFLLVVHECNKSWAVHSNSHNKDINRSLRYCPYLLCNNHPSPCQQWHKGCHLVALCQLLSLMTLQCSESMTNTIDQKLGHSLLVCLCILSVCLQSATQSVPFLTLHEFSGFFSCHRLTALVMLFLMIIVFLSISSF